MSCTHETKKGKKLEQEWVKLILGRLFEKTLLLQ
jgi:hypothetical protein